AHLAARGAALVDAAVEVGHAPIAAGPVGGAQQRRAFGVVGASLAATARNFRRAAVGRRRDELVAAGVVADAVLDRIHAQLAGRRAHLAVRAIDGGQALLAALQIHAAVEGIAVGVVRAGPLLRRLADRALIGEIDAP